MARQFMALWVLGALAAIATLAAVGSAAATAPDRAASGVGGVSLTPLGEFDSPVYTATAPGRANRRLLFVVERSGVVRVIRRGRVLPRPFLDISPRVGDRGERGLLSIAFAPDYPQSRRFYVYYTTDTDGSIRVAQMRTSPHNEVVAKPSEREVITIPHPVAASHNGGQVSFGPDGNLWLATGDGGSACDPLENAQNPASLLGKLLRIDPGRRGGYSIPKGNPFVNRPGADEIYSLGLRNPFRFSLDRKTGTIAIADVGERAFEEVDYETLASARGANFGWDAFEGSAPLVLPEVCAADAPTAPRAEMEPPAFEYGHSGGAFSGCAITGGLIVRDRRLPTLLGRYLYSDVCNGQLRGIVLDAGGASGDVALGPSVAAPTSFREGRRHRIYVTTLDGDVFRLSPAS